jgi:predicted ribosome quality control (RQC) complex YloA/Tae2 family protein
MKKELSSIEIKYLVDELQYLLGSRVENIYHPEKKEFLIVFHSSSAGKQMLRAVLPGFLWVTETKQDMPERISGFCALLRKYLDRAVASKIMQLGSERIVELEFDGREGKYSLVLELFSKGNAVFCQKGEIMMPLEIQEWKDRAVKKGEKYVLPSREHSAFELNLPDFKKILSESKETVSKAMATSVGIGGTFAEEACLRAGVDKKKKKLDDAEIKKLYEALTGLLQQKIEPNAIFDDNKAVDIVPFKLQLYSEYRQESFKTYSQALDSVLSKGIGEEKLARVEEQFKKQIERVDKKIEMQEENLKEIYEKTKEEQRKGEVIYEKYQELQKLLSAVKEMREKHGWKEMKEKLKPIKYIKQVNEKTSEITIELKDS